MSDADEVVRVLSRTVLGLHPEPGPKRDEMIRDAADALAKAGLLRAYDPDAECGVCGGTRDRAEMWRRSANRTDYALADIMPTLWRIFSDATENERQMLDAVDVLIEQARHGAKGAQSTAQEPEKEVGPIT